MKTLIVLSAALVFGIGGSAGAAEQFGVPVYPGATSDAATERYCKEYNDEAVRQAKGTQQPLAVSAAVCFRTADDFRKVVGFYQHQKTLQPLGQPIDRGPQKSALFCLQGMRSASLGNGVDVFIATPWSEGANSYPDAVIVIRQAAKQ